MRILGIDPGYAIVGFGVVSYHGADFTPLEYGAITTEAGTRFAARLTAIYDDLDFLLKRFQPDCIAIERLYFTSNQKTVIDVAQARGVIVLCAEQHQIPMYEYTPLQVKQAVVGYGKAEKRQVMDDDGRNSRYPGAAAGRCRRCPCPCDLPRTLCNRRAAAKENHQSRRYNMIYSVHGKLIAKEPAMAVVECGGVGYACRTTLHTLGQVGNLGETVLLYTAMSVREDAVELFGFSTQQELQCFQLLTSVSGVGPKAALSILSDLTPDQFLLTVASGDSKALTRAKGIGAKSAQRIVMELKDKIAGDATGLLSGTAGAGEIAAATQSGGNVGEAIEALVTLGYTQSEVAPIVAKLDPSLSPSDLIRLALQEFGKQRNF